MRILQIATKVAMFILLVLFLFYTISMIWDFVEIVTYAKILSTILLLFCFIVPVYLYTKID